MVNLETARAVTEAAQRKAQEIGQPMNIAVVDAGGNLVSHVRMDGAWLGSIDISINKAFTARAFDMAAKDLAEESQSGGSLFGINTTDDGRIVIFAGGIPLQDGDQVVGRQLRSLPSRRGSCPRQTGRDQENARGQVGRLREERVKRLILLVTLVLALSATPALAVNDPFTPGEECAAQNSQAVGHPAFVHQPPQGANPPFSANNPGSSTGARSEANSRAEAHCQNAQAPG